jgi:hypothetical protein
MPVKLDFEPDGVHHVVPIVFSDILTMVQYYRSTLPNETKSAWVSASEVLKLLADNNGNGIRIYYGRHAQNSPIYANQHNVILVATRDTVNPDNPACENSDDLLNYSATPEKPANSVVVSYNYSGNGDDAIPLCPPRCPLKVSPLS